jgi:hypothetical protein
VIELADPCKCRRRWKNETARFASVLYIAWLHWAGQSWKWLLKRDRKKKDV